LSTPSKTDFFKSNKTNYINILEKQNKKSIRSKSNSFSEKIIDKFDYKPSKIINKIKNEYLEKHEYWPNDQKKQQTGKHFDTMNKYNTREIVGP